MVWVGWMGCTNQDSEEMMMMIQSTSMSTSPPLVSE